jgi:hypothetical protein
VDIRKITTQGQHKQKAPEIPSQPVKPAVVVLACHPSYQGSTNRNVFQASLVINMGPDPQNN